MNLAAADSFNNCVMFGTLGTFQKVHEWQESERHGGLLVDFCWLWFVKLSCTKTQKEIRYFGSKNQTCPKELSIPNQLEVV
jgi:hypothetical protein